MKLVHDQMLRQVNVPDCPMRIVSLVPSQTELLYHWGLGDRVVGITKFCIHPEQWYRTKTRIGGTKKINVEALQALNPDLIIGNKEENAQEDIEQLQKDYPVWMSDMQDLEDVWQMMGLLGAVLGVEKESQTLVEQLKRDFDSLLFNPNGYKPKVAYFIWKNPFMVAASDTFIHTILEKAGFDNVFAHQKRYPVVEAHELAALEPEWILLSSEPYPFGEKHRGLFQEICPRAAIEIVDGELFSWYGARLLKTVAYLKELRKKMKL